MQIDFTINGRDVSVSVESQETGDGWKIGGAGAFTRIEGARMLPGNILEILLIGASDSQRVLRVPTAQVDGRTHVSYGGRTYAIAQEEPADRPRARARRKATGSLTAPMMGVVAEVLVGEGQSVAAHEPLVVIEAMKVMATVEAPFAGVVTKVHFAKGDVVPHGGIVVDMTPSGAGEPSET